MYLVIVALVLLSSCANACDQFGCDLDRAALKVTCRPDINKLSDALICVAAFVENVKSSKVIPASGWPNQESRCYKISKLVGKDNSPVCGHVSPGSQPHSGWIARMRSFDAPLTSEVAKRGLTVEFNII